MLPQPERITDRQGLPQAFVPTIIQDKQGFIWMGTRDGLCRYDGSRFKVFQPDPDGRPSLSSADVALLHLDRQGNLWISNERGDVDLFDPVTEQFTSRVANPVRKLPILSTRLNRFCIDQQNRFWTAASDKGLICLDLTTRRLQHYRYQPDQPQSLSDNTIVDIQEGREGTIWALTRTGLDGFDKKTHAIRHYLNPSDLETSPKGLWVRPSGDVLVATDRWLLVVEPTSGQVQKHPLPAPIHMVSYSHFAEDQHGTVYFARNTEIFSFAQEQGVRLLDPGSNQPQDAYLCAFIDQSDVLWLGTAGAGVRKYDLRTQPFETARYQTGFVPDIMRNWLNLPSGAIPPFYPGLTSYNFRYTFDKQGRLWYNTGSSDLFRIDIKEKKTVPIRFPIQFRTGIIGPVTCPLATDPAGRVWALYDQTAYWFDELHGQWLSLPYRIPYRKDQALQMLTVDEQALWISISSGGLLRVDRSNGQTKTYTNIRGNPASLSSNSLLCMATDPDNPDWLWIGTFGSGLCRFDKKTGLVKRLSLADGLPNNVVYSVIPDHHGDLWMGTNKGLARMNRRTLAIQTYTTDDGILANEFNRFHFLHMPDDRILMGGLEGLTAFNPGQIKADTFQPRVEMTTLFVNNKPVLPGPNSPLGLQPLQATSKLALPYHQNFLTVEFTALQFNKPAKNRYRYQLAGLDESWVESRRSEAVFTGLRPGTYTLRLNASNVSGRWSSHIRSLTIRIDPPWWETWWAYILYAGLVAGVGYGLFKNYVNRLRLQQSMSLKEHETQQLRALDGMKNRFFANITHEFRTPLTLILAPTEQLMGDDLEPRVRRRLTTIEQNAHQLLRLINQLLDLSRLEASVMPVNPSRGELTNCVLHWLQPLTEQATAQGIALSFHSTVRGSYWFDVEKFERIVYNLTANALKFTPVGTITVSLEPLAIGIQLTVADTGIGISARQLPHIFDRFYQASDTQSPRDGGPVGTLRPSQAGYSSPDQHGTGIGLALVKELIHLQQGTIAVESTVGKGSVFVVTLPYEQVAASSDPADVDQPLQPDPIDASASSDSETDVPRILIVEDNDELAHFIAESLPAAYRIRRAVNGWDGLEQSLDYQPDLIISDVMMPVQSGTGRSEPEMDGFALCSKLKTDLRTSHIPVVLLTAKVTIENRLEGLALGADDYLTKPFHVEELRLRVHNLLEQRRRQRAWLQQTLTAVGPANEPALPEDPFLIRLYALLDTNLDNPRLNVDQLIDELAMSRTNLHRKVKALTGFSTNELIRTYRLKVATKLLRQGLNSSETAMRVGFENLSYFAKCFRELYGSTPGEFARTHQQNG
ncbi:hybrid sensor histidine kinase/response regulator transcription factor [Spirosoma koreense]